MSKNIQTDFCEPWSIIRTIVSTETLTPVPGLLGKRVDATQVFRCQSKILAVRMWANANNANPVVGIFAEAVQDGDKYPMGNHVVLGTFTHSGLSIASLNPITGEASADTWYALSNFVPSATGHSTPQVNKVPDYANTSYEMRLVIDALGDTLWYPYATSMGGTAASKIIVAMRQVE